jgi:hypothetical protein
MRFGCFRVTEWHEVSILAPDETITITLDGHPVNATNNDSAETPPDAPQEEEDDPAEDEES